MPSYVYATRLVRSGPQHRLGLPSFTPPDASPGWEICGLSYTTRGIIVTWRTPGTVTGATYTMDAASGRKPA